MQQKIILTISVSAGTWYSSLLESRLGETTDAAMSARIIEQGFGDLARKIHNQTVQVAQESALVSRSQTA